MFHAGGRRGAALIVARTKEAAVESRIEALESRRLLSGASGIVGEYHGVLQFEHLPAGVMQDVGGTRAGGAFTTNVILTLNTLTKNGVVTGTLKASKLGDFNVAGRAQHRRLSLELSDNDSTAQALAVSTATFSAPNRGDGNLRGNFVEMIDSATVSGAMRLRFMKGLTTTSSSFSTPATTSAATQDSTTAISTTTSTAIRGSTLDISGTTPTAIHGGTLDISGTNPMGSSGSLDISGTRTTAPQSGTLDISGTTFGGATGAPDISGSNSNNGLGSVFNGSNSSTSSSFASTFGASVFFR
jgi:hypothetical protein